MDKIPRRYNKVNKEDKLNKKSMKHKEKCGKSKFEQLLLDIKNSKNLPRNGQNPGKITSGRITVKKSGIFSHAERSDIVYRNDKTKLNEESQAILNEDLLKIIDLANPPKNERKIKSSVDIEVFNQFSNNLCLEDNSSVVKSQDFSDIVDCVSDNKSLFKIIDVKYEQLIKDNRKSDNNESFMDLENIDLEKFVESRMDQSDHSDIWERHTKEVFEHKRIKDYEQSTIKTIVQEQKQIVQDCIINEIATDYRDTPVTNTIKRKFIKRFNEMTLVNNGCQSETHCNSSDIDGLKHQPQGCSTPIKDTIFPETSYHTPENQKYVYKVPDTEVYQTVLYVAPDEHQNNLKQKVSQKENFVEVIVPPSVSNQTGLYEITTKESDFVFSPKMENHKSRNPFGSLENTDKDVLSKWKNQLKHVYDCPPKKDNIQLGENTVINLRKNLLFDDCDNVLSRPKKIIKRNRSSDISLKNISSSPFSKFLNETTDINCSITKSEIRRKLNYSNDLSFDGEQFETIATDENIKHFPASLFTEVGESSKTNFQFTKPKSYFEMGENSKKHKIDYDCKCCTKYKVASERTYKSNYIPTSPQFNDMEEPIFMPKSPKYDFKSSKQFFTEIGESSKSNNSEHLFGPSKHYSPNKNRHNRYMERHIKSPKKHESFKLEIKELSKPNTSENFDWKPFDDSKNEKDHFKSLIVEPTSPNRCSKILPSRSRSPFNITNTNTNYSPGDKRKCWQYCLRSPKRNRLQVVPLSPSEYMLRKKILPHTVTSDMKPKNNSDSPVFRLF